MSEEFEQKVIEYLDKIYTAIINKSENREPPKDIKIEEYIDQDLEGVTILKELPRSYLVFKNGYTCPVAYSHLKEGYIDAIELGSKMDLNKWIRDDRQWIFKKNKNGVPNLKWEKWTEATKQ